MDAVKIMTGIAIVIAGLACALLPTILIARWAGASDRLNTNAAVLTLLMVFSGFTTTPIVILAALLAPIRR